MNQERYHDAKQYVENLSQQIGALYNVHVTGNLEIDAIISSKLVEARNNNIKVEHFITVGKKLPIGEMDLSVLLGNALDNAIEACNRYHESQAEILIKMDMDQQGLKILIENTMDKMSIKQSGSGFRTSKEDEQIKHGYGIDNMKRVVEKYGGNLVIDLDDHWFKLRIVVPF